MGIFCRGVEKVCSNHDVVFVGDKDNNADGDKVDDEKTFCFCYHDIYSPALTFCIYLSFIYLSIFYISIYLLIYLSIFYNISLHISMYHLLSIYFSHSGEESDPLKIDLSKPNNFTRGNVIIIIIYCHHLYHHQHHLSSPLSIVIII